MTYWCCPLMTSLLSTSVLLMCSALGLGVGGRSLYCDRGGSLKGRAMADPIKPISGGERGDSLTDQSLICILGGII